MLQVTLTYCITHIAKNFFFFFFFFFFFDIPAATIKKFFLDELDAGRGYALKLLMLDTSTNYSIFNDTVSVYTTPAFDNTPSAIVENTVTNRTDTTVTTRLTTAEFLKRLIIRYRIIGTNQWMEQVIIPSMMTFDIMLSDLAAGQSYECQYLLEDNSGNQLLTKWEGM